MDDIDYAALFQDMRQREGIVSEPVGEVQIPAEAEFQPASPVPSWPAASETTLTMYTDGSSQGAFSPGGWAFVVLEGEKRLHEAAGFLKQASNNEAEMWAAIHGLRWIEKHVQPAPAVLVVSDSQYLVNGASEWAYGWKMKGWRNTSGKAANIPLWETILDIQSRLRVDWKHVRGHSGNKWNDRCDFMAGEARKEGMGILELQGVRRNPRR